MARRSELENIFRSKYRFAFAAGTFGFCVSLLCYSVAFFRNDVSDWMFFVWPSMIMLLAIFHPGITAIIGITISILVNVALYAGMGQLLALMIGAVGNIFRRK